jgi:hydrogenase maturation protease
VTVLVAGVGNLFRGDDGFGCEVIRRIAGRALPAGVVVRDFGTSALDLRFWTERHDVVIVVDVVARELAPGELVVIDPAACPGASSEPGLHGASSSDVVAWAAARRDRGEQPHVVRVVGCVPATFGDDEEGALGLSAPVAAAVEPAVECVVALVSSLVSSVVSPPGRADVAPGSDVRRA